MNRLLSAAPIMALLSFVSQPAQAADPAKGKTAFQSQCAVCHGIAATSRGIGPSLFKVVGRKAGTLAGYSYSPAMKTFGKPWTPALLNTYLTAPQNLVKGNKMPFAGISDAARRADLVAYLATIK